MTDIKEREVIMELTSLVYNKIISVKPIEEYNDYERLLIHRTFDNLFPNEKEEPTIQEAINKITNSFNSYGRK